MRARGYWEWRDDGQRLYITDKSVVGSVTHLSRVPYGMDAGWYAWAAPLCVLKVEDVSEGMTLVELCARPHSGVKLGDPPLRGRPKEER